MKAGSYSKSQNYQSHKSKAKKLNREVEMRLRHTAVILFVATLASSAFAQQLTTPAIEKRIDILLQQMTLEEKVGQLEQHDNMNDQTAEQIKEGKIGALFNVLGADKTNALQHVAMEQSRLKIPILFGFDVIHGYRTIFPVPLASAGSFDPAMIEQSERVAAKEASAAGVKWVFAPMVDIARDPRWGRIVEGAGEDPYLGSMVAAARVRGFQGSSMADPDSVIACAKHFVGYGAVEGGREYNTVEISQRTLREIYLPPFHAAVDAGVGTIMSAFESLNGVPASADHFTLTEILRNEWGFQGMVDSDYNSVDQLIQHGIAANSAQATQKAIMAGVDMDMADGDYLRELPGLVRSGQVPITVVDEAVRRVLRVKFAAGLFDHPYTDPNRASMDILSPANLEVARKMADESIVLLKNQNNVLPLSKKIKTLAVIGPLADDKADQLGPWAGAGKAEDAITPLAGIKAKIPGSTVLYQFGTEIPPFEKPGSNPIVAAPAPVSATGVSAHVQAEKPASIEEAVKAAKHADAVVMFLGELAGMTGEASSRATLNLPGKQQQLLEAVVATGKPVVLVLESGRPLDIRWANDHVPAIIQAWFPGVEAGNAIAGILFGDVNPSAKLPLSWPLSVGQIPNYYNHLNTGRPTSPDRWHTGYIDESKLPLFPFGYGLSYTTFAYSDLHVESSTIPQSGTLHVTAEVKNTGQRTGTEIAEFYIRDLIAPTSQPVKELKGFTRVTLAPGEEKQVEFTVQAHDLGSYNTAMQWVVPEGTYDMWVGPSSAQGMEGSFQIEGQ
jgi:beta-glucosidase